MICTLTSATLASAVLSCLVLKRSLNIINFCHFCSLSSLVIDAEAPGETLSTDLRFLAKLVDRARRTPLETQIRQLSHLQGEICTSFFFGWKAAILSAISSRAENLQEKRKYKSWQISSRSKKITFAWNLPSLFSAWSPDFYFPESKWWVEWNIKEYLWWRGLTELGVFKSIQNTSLLGARLLVPGGKHSQCGRLFPGSHLFYLVFRF